MSRLVYRLAHRSARVNAIQSVSKAPDGWFVEVREPTRSTEQSKLMWARLTDISEQGNVNSRQFEPEQWKCMFMQALGHEMRYLPTLDGSSFFPIGLRSSKLTVSEMRALLDFIDAYAAENGITLKDTIDVSA